MEFQIIHEAVDYVVVQKPAGMLSHPTKPGQPLTLWDHLRRVLACDLQVPGRQISLINRLDRETSGLMLVALTSRVARAFGLAMQARLIRKEYLALVHGWPAQDAWSVDAPLDAQRRHGPTAVHLRQIVHPAGYPAQTEFRVLERLTRGPEQRQIALVQAAPHTGRMHQIRVHLAHSGYPVVGDKLYGPPPGEELYLRFIETGWTPELAAHLHLRHHALHSATLSWDDIPLTTPDDEITPEVEEFLPAASYACAMPAEWRVWLDEGGMR